MLRRLRRWLEFRRKGIRAWRPCNIYPTARIGYNVSIGRYAEIGDNVRIGSNVRIGKGAFIPAGVVIGDGAFVGPHVCFSNDMYPPSPKGQWVNTYVAPGASIGANASIRPGVHIGFKALVGMGSVVTHNIPANEIWAGVPCKFLRKREG